MNNVKRVLILVAVLISPIAFAGDNNPSAGIANKEGGVIANGNGDGFIPPGSSTVSQTLFCIQDICFKF